MCPLEEVGVSYNVCSSMGQKGCEVERRLGRCMSLWDDVGRGTTTKTRGKYLQQQQNQTCLPYQYSIELVQCCSDTTIPIASCLSRQNVVWASSYILLHSGHVSLQLLSHPTAIPS
jgi:hypothetical protein